MEKEKYYLEDIIHERIFAESHKTHNIYQKFINEKIINDKDKIIEGQNIIIFFLLEKIKELLPDNIFNKIYDYYDEINWQIEKDDPDYMINKIKEWEKNNYNV